MHGEPLVAGSDPRRSESRKATHLVDEVLAMVVAEGLGPDDTVEIGLHEFLDEVDFLEELEGGGLEDVEDGDDVLVAKVAEELDLAESAKTEHVEVEGGDALDGDLALGGDVDGRAVVDVVGGVSGLAKGDTEERGRLTRRCHRHLRR